MQTATTPSSREYWLWRALSYGMIVVSISIIAYRFWKSGVYLPDDSYITYRFAQHLAEGHGLVWNIGGERVEGYTSPLHVALLAIAFRIGLPIQDAANFINLLSILGLIVFFILFIRRYVGYISPIAIFFLCLYLTDARLSAIHLNAGLDTPLFMFLLALVFGLSVAFVRAPGPTLAATLALVNILCLLGRPDAAPYLLGQAIIVVSFAVFQKRTLGQNALLNFTLLAYGLSLVMGMAYLLWKYLYFGYLFPNPYYIKANDPLTFQGTGHVYAFLEHLFRRYIIFALPIVPFLDYRSILAWLKEPFSKVELFLLLLPPTLFLLYYTTVVHAVCFAFRFEYPTLFFFCLTIALLLSVGSPEERLQGLLSRISARRVFVSIVLAITTSIFVTSAFYYAYKKDRRWNRQLFKPMIVRHYAPIAEALRRTELGSKAVLMFDSVGYIPFVSGFNNIDPIGLTDNVLSGRIPISALDREKYIWSKMPDVYLGPTPPATPGSRNYTDEPLFESTYMRRVFLERITFIEYRRIYAGLSQEQLQEVLHFRMRELRDHWLFLGEIPYPFPAPPEYTHFVYVRKETPYLDLLVRELEPLVFRKPDEFDFDDPLRNRKEWH